MRMTHVVLLSMLIAPAARAQEPAVALPSDVYTESQVDRPAMKQKGSAFPKYPESLKANQVEGEVLVRFVIDTSGTPILDSFKVIKSSNPAFSDAVKSALHDMQFSPAELKGKKVKQLFQGPFVFAKPVPKPAPAKKPVGSR